MTVSANEKQALLEIAASPHQYYLVLVDGKEAKELIKRRTRGVDVMHQVTRKFYSKHAAYQWLQVYLGPEWPNLTLDQAEQANWFAIPRKYGEDMEQLQVVGKDA